MSAIEKNLNQVMDWLDGETPLDSLSRDEASNLLGVALAVAKGEYSPSDEADQNPEKPGVWVLLFDHKHGTDVSVYATEEAANNAELEIIKTEPIHGAEPEEAAEILQLLKEGKSGEALECWNELQCRCGHPESTEILLREVEAPKKSVVCECTACGHSWPVPADEILCQCPKCGRTHQGPRR